VFLAASKSEHWICSLSVTADRVFVTETGRAKLH
jgi:hypothetical protein